MRLASITPAEGRELQETIGELYGLGGDAPYLLQTARDAGLEAKGALAEARAGFEEVGGLIRGLGHDSESRFTELRALLVDGQLEPVGSIGLRRGEPPTWRHFTQGGVAHLVAGLSRVERFEEESGVEFEVRLLVVTDLLCEALVLLPVGGQQGPRFLCLSPGHGGPQPDSPLSAAEFVDHLQEVRDLVTAGNAPGRPAGPFKPPAAPPRGPVPGRPRSRRPRDG